MSSLVRDFIEGFPDLHGIEIFLLAKIIGGKLCTEPIHDIKWLRFLFIEVEELESIRFYPKSFIAKLKKLGDNRDLSEKNLYMRSAP